MSDRVGVSLSAGKVSVPATFHGTARLVDGSMPQTAPAQIRHDDLPASFHADVNLDFDMLRSLGFEPVAPTHPAYPRFLAASASPAPATTSKPSSGLDLHSPHAVRLPFTTTFTITADVALQHGLVAPGGSTAKSSSPEGAGMVRPVQRRPAPPPYAPSSNYLNAVFVQRNDSHIAIPSLGTSKPPSLMVGMKDAAVPGPSAFIGPQLPIGDFNAFLEFMRDPGLNPLSARNKTAVDQSVDASTQAGIDYLDRNASEHSGGRCGHALNEALRAEGLDWKNVNYAKNFGPQLQSTGFKIVSQTNYQPQEGDIAVINDYRGGNVAGHIAMWDGRTWVSDFRQQNKPAEKVKHGFFTPYPGQGYRDAMPAYSIYRR